MNTAIILLLALQTPAEPPLIPAFFTAEGLHEICRRPNAGQCSMYVAGVLDGLFYASSRSNAPELCPKPINNREAAALVGEFLASNPEMRPRAAALAVREALSERLGCDGPSPERAPG